MRNWKQRLLYRLLREYGNALCAEDKRAAVDPVLQTMDMIKGWCAPHRRLEKFYRGR